MSWNSSKMTVAVVGQGGVGKSAITLQLVNNKFVEEYDPTIEDSYRKQIYVDKKACVLDILDTAGQEMYNAYRDSYYKNAQGFLLLYSITSVNTFREINSFVEAIHRVKDSERVPKVLCGNKCDLTESRVVLTTDGSELAKKLSCPFFETSAKTNKNVEESFFELVRQIRKEYKTLAKEDGSNKKNCIIL